MICTLLRPSYTTFLFRMIVTTSSFINLVHAAQDQQDLSSCPVEKLSYRQIGDDLLGEQVGDLFGNYISLSNNGDVLAVGAVNNGINGASSGSVMVFTRNGNEWIQKGSTIYGENPLGESGPNALSGDGETIAIGSPFDSEVGERFGKVRVYKFIESDWVQVGADIDGLEIDALFGNGLSFSNDGLVLAVGAGRHGSNLKGQIRVFQYQSITQEWEQVGNEINGDGEFDQLQRVSLSETGNTLAVGGYDAGRVRVYQLVSGNWNQIGQDLVADDGDSSFGFAISLSPDGQVVTIGGGPFSIEGYVLVYTYQNNEWVQDGNILRSDVSDYGFGYSIARSGDGKFLVVGSPYHSTSGRGQVFYFQDNNWIQLSDDIVGEQPGENLGEAVAMSLDGSTFAIGSTYFDANTIETGIVKVFEITCQDAPTMSPTLVPVPSPIFQPGTTAMPARAPVGLPPIPPITLPTSDPPPDPCFLGFICSCFSSNNLVQVQGKGLIPLNKLQIGDFIQVSLRTKTSNYYDHEDNYVYSRVISFSHKDETSQGNFLRLHVQKFHDASIDYCDDYSAIKPLEISSNHIIQKSDATFVRANDIQVGDFLQGDMKVVKVDVIKSQGLYAPVTEMGTIVVSGITASSYVAILENLPAWIQHYGAHALYAPIRLFTKLHSFGRYEWNYNEDYTDDGLSDNYVMDIVRRVYKLGHYSQNIQIVLAFVLLLISGFVLVMEQLLVLLFLQKVFFAIILVCLITFSWNSSKRKNII